MARQNIQILGERELQRIFRALPDRVGYRVLMSGLSGAARKVVASVRKEVPIDTKNLWRSIGVKRGKNRSRPSVIAAVRIGRKAKYDGWYGWFVEKGTRGFGRRTQRATNAQGTGLAYAHGGSGLEATNFFSKGVEIGLPLAKNYLHEAISKAVVRYLRRNVPRYR